MPKLSVPLSKTETISGIGYLIFQLIFLPGVIVTALSVTGLELNLAQINFLFYCVNFLCVLIIFRKFLLRNLDTAIASPGRLLKTVLFGMGRYLMLNILVSSVVLMLDPEFMNANDETVMELVHSELPLMALGTIVLVPPVEESLFRGLIFRNLYDRHPVGAYLVSTVAFSAIHLMNYLTVYTPMELLIAFLQYVPAGLCLAWAYVRADSIFAPILLHALVNTMGIAAMR